MQIIFQGVKTMKYNAVLATLIFTVMLAGTHFKNNTATAGQVQPPVASQKAGLKNGAQLYDNWLKMTKTETEGNHPRYPVESKKSGKSTWRCKECHGWDYIGDKGRYSKGSHFTGITGVFHVQTESPEFIYTALTNKLTGHDFSAYLSPNQIIDLVTFLREGQADIEAVIDNQGKGKGDVAPGRTLYDAQCSSCHGADGNKLDFKDGKEGIQGVGWLANDNPQESIHNIRWGHPGSDMPSMLVDKGLSEQDSIDILTYSQSLDTR